MRHFGFQRPVLSRILHPTEKLETAADGDDASCAWPPEAAWTRNGPNIGVVPRLFHRESRRETTRVACKWPALARNRKQSMDKNPPAQGQDPSGQQTANKLRTAYLHSPQLLKQVAETPLGCCLELHGTLAGGQEPWNHRRPDDGGGLRKYFLLTTASTDEMAMQVGPSVLVLPSR